MRFVLFQHDLPGGAGQEASHLDFMIEIDGQLRTWSLPSWPQASETVVAEELPPHRLDYLDYEGSVSDDRGNVRRLDRGTFWTIQESATQIVVLLSGETRSGVAEFTKQTDVQWSLNYESVGNKQRSSFASLAPYSRTVG